MTLTLPLGPVATFISGHPWPTVALVFLAVVIAPAVWSHRQDRQRAAMAVIRVILEAVTAVAGAICRSHGAQQNSFDLLKAVPRRPGRRAGGTVGRRRPPPRR